MCVIDKICNNLDDFELYLAYGMMVLYVAMKVQLKLLIKLPRIKATFMR